MLNHAIILPPDSDFVNIQYVMDTYDNEPKPYGSHWWWDFIYIGMICGIVLLGYFLPKWLG